MESVGNVPPGVKPVVNPIKKPELKLESYPLVKTLVELAEQKAIRLTPNDTTVLNPAAPDPLPILKAQFKTDLAQAVGLIENKYHKTPWEVLLQLKTDESFKAIITLLDVVEDGLDISELLMHTIVQTAAQEGQHACLEALFNHPNAPFAALAKKNIDLRDALASTALDKAVGKNHPKAAQALITAGATSTVGQRWFAAERIGVSRVQAVDTLAGAGIWAAKRPFTAVKLYFTSGAAKKTLLAWEMMWVLSPSMAKTVLDYTVKPAASMVVNVVKYPVRFAVKVITALPGLIARLLQEKVIQELGIIGGLSVAAYGIGVLFLEKVANRTYPTIQTKMRQVVHLVPQSVTDMVHDGYTGAKSTMASIASHVSLSEGVLHTAVLIRMIFDDQLKEAIVFPDIDVAQLAESAVDIAWHFGRVVIPVGFSVLGVVQAHGWRRKRDALAAAQPRAVVAPAVPAVPVAVVALVNP